MTQPTEEKYATTVVKTPILSRVKPYDLKWEQKGDMEFQTTLKYPERFTFVDYARSGVRQSAKGSSYLVLETKSADSEEEDKSGVPGLLSAAHWVTDLCTQLAKISKPYLDKQFQAIPGNKLPYSTFSPAIGYSVQAENGMSEVKEMPADLNAGFKRGLVVYPSKYTKFYSMDNGRETLGDIYDQMKLRNSFYRIDLNVKTFQFRLFESEKKLLVRCFVNVGALTYMDETIEGITPPIVQKAEERRAEKTNSLLELIRKKKRKVE